jgi:hypothetical protein
MSFIDDVVKDLISSLGLDEAERDSDRLRERIEKLTREAPPLEILLSPPIDVAPNFLLFPEEPSIGCSEPPEPYKWLLGIYIPMHSPGTVVLFIRNLRWFYWRLLQSALRQVSKISKVDLNEAARLVVLKTYYHEIFHFDCDVLRHLNHSQYGDSDREREEALAVARARSRIIDDHKDGRTTFGKMNSVLFNILLDEAFRYSSPGYRDWPNFSDEPSFKFGILKHIQPKNYPLLRANGVAVENLLFNQLNPYGVGGYIEVKM